MTQEIVDQINATYTNVQTIHQKVWDNEKRDREIQTLKQEVREVNRKLDLILQKLSQLDSEK